MGLRARSEFPELAGIEIELEAAENDPNGWRSLASP